MRQRAAFSLVTLLFLALSLSFPLVTRADGRRVAARSVGFMPGIATWLSQRTRLAGV